MSDVIRLEIRGMTCNHCVAAVKKELAAVAGVEDAQVTLEPGSAMVTGNAPVEALIAAIRQAGYEAQQPQGS